VTALDHERDWWGSCTNTWREEEKQRAYSRHILRDLRGEWPWFDLDGRTVLDIGGGPVSMLLKTENASYRTVLDPCEYPEWVTARYAAHGIEYRQARGEDAISSIVGRYDEAWIYNVLQHTDDPEQVVRSAMVCGRTVRIFEWTDVEPCPMHPHRLTADLLDEWTGIQGARVYGVNAEWGETDLAWAWAGVLVSPSLATISG
jgi:hypothetical protein